MISLRPLLFLIAQLLLSTLTKISGNIKANRASWHQMRESEGKMPQRLLTVPQAATEMGLSARTVWAWVYARKLSVVRLGRAVRIPQTAIDDLIEFGTVPAKVER
jgi:excisionase family DNA binding protein